MRRAVLRRRTRLALTAIGLVLLAGCERDSNVTVDEAPVEEPAGTDDAPPQPDDADADSGSGDGEVGGFGCQ